MKAVRGAALDLKKDVVARLGEQPERVWTPVDFLDLGPRAAVDKTLQRLVVEKAVSRVERGLYHVPRHNPLTGKPTVAHYSAVIDAVTRRDQARVVVDGLTAANDLGLTTAVPARIVVLTDARLQPITLGRQQIRFQTAAPSRLYWAGRPGMRIVQALHWLQDMLDTDRLRIVAQLRRILDDPAYGAAMRSDLKQGLPTLPIWMQSVVREVFETKTKAPRGRRRPPHRATHRQPSMRS